MTWEEYYNSFEYWNEAKRIKNLFYLTEFGPSNEVCELTQKFTSQQKATAFVRKALDAGVKFTADEVADIINVIDDELRTDLLNSSYTPYTFEHYDDMSDYLDDDRRKNLYSQITNKRKKKNAEVDKKKKLGKVLLIICGIILAISVLYYLIKVLMLLLAVVIIVSCVLLALFFNTSNKSANNKKCDGNCSNCPPHYGYRYGRWYYGHGHIEGCEFGGNKSDCDRD